MTVESPAVQSGAVSTILRTTALALVLCYAGRGLIPWSTDLLCYWTAGTLIAHGHSPYDPIAQTQIQRELGWDKAIHGGGRYDFLPFFCPPWFALLCAPLTLLDYPAAARVLYFLNIEFVLFSSLLLAGAIKSVHRVVPAVVLWAFFPTLLAIFAGQVSLLILLMITVSWRLIDRHRDRTAGAVMAWLTIKPQLSAVLLAGVLLWAARRRRWGVLCGFTAGLGLLCLASTAILPTWPGQMLNATRVTPLPTDFWPWVGASWTLALRTLGLHGWPLLIAYTVVALPLGALTLNTAWSLDRPLRDVLALALIASFFISPYAQLYDFPILVLPLLVLYGERRPAPGSTILLTAFLATPYVYLIIFCYLDINNLKNNYFDKYLLFLIPAALALAWCVILRRERPGELPPKQDRSRLSNPNNLPDQTPVSMLI